MHNLLLNIRWDLVVLIVAFLVVCWTGGSTWRRDGGGWIV